MHQAFGSEKCTHNFAGKPQLNRPLERSSCRIEYIIMDLREMGYESVD
jgi:hypothetical protein